MIRRISVLVVAVAFFAGCNAEALEGGGSEPDWSLPGDGKADTGNEDSGFSPYLQCLSGVWDHRLAAPKLEHFGDLRDYSVHFYGPVSGDLHFFHLKMEGEAGFWLYVGGKGYLFMLEDLSRRLEDNGHYASVVHYFSMRYDTDRDGTRETTYYLKHMMTSSGRIMDSSQEPEAGVEYTPLAMEIARAVEEYDPASRSEYGSAAWTLQWATAQIVQIPRMSYIADYTSARAAEAYGRTPEPLPNKADYETAWTACDQVDDEMVQQFLTAERALLQSF